MTQTPFASENISAELLEKIRKLLSLAGNNPNEAEASAASLKAAELAMRAGLSLSSVMTLAEDAALAEEDRAMGGAVIEDVATVNTYAPQWRLQLLHGLAEAMHCKLVVVSTGTVTEKKNGKRRFRTDSSRWRLIGTPGNIGSVTELYQYLSSTIVRLAREAVPQAQSDYVVARQNLTLPDYYYDWPELWTQADLKKWLRKHPDGGRYVRDFQPHAFQTAFSEACVYRVVQRVEAREQEMAEQGLASSEEGPAISALVVASQAKQWQQSNQALYNKLYPPSPHDDLLNKKRRSRRERDPFGTEAGLQAGETLGLSPQLRARP